MPKRLAYTQYDLRYPPWALEFDPYNRGYLLVGGGGGEGQKEVPNRLTLLDIASRSQISKAAELSTTNLEDCPVSLGVLGTKQGLIVYAGVNSVASERKRGVNNHFRSFKIDYPARAQTKSDTQEQGTITALGQAPLFSDEANTGDVFQRLLRLSPASKRAAGSKRIGAVANSLAKESQIVLFNATAASPGPADVIHRVKPPRNAEANDIDIYETQEGQFRFAYCTPTEVYVQSVSYDFDAKKATKLSPQEPYATHSIPPPDASQKLGRPKIRSLRFLTPDHILLLVNRGGQSELAILRLYEDGTDGDVVLRKLLPRRMGAAVSLDVCALDADPGSGVRQIVVAVAAQSQDVSVFTVDYFGTAKGTVSAFTQYSDLRDVHTMAMKKVVLSPFHSPWSSSDSPSDASSKLPGPQYLRLASVSLANTLIVDHLPLQPLSPGKRGSRYVLSGKRSSSALTAGTGLFTVSFVLLISLLLLQSVLSAQGSSAQLLPPALMQRLGPFTERANAVIGPYLRRVEDSAAPLAHSKSSERLRSLLQRHHEARLAAPADQQEQQQQQKKKMVVVIRAPHADDGAAELGTEVHDDHEEVLRRDADAKRWEELSSEQQAVWKQRLVEAGAWSAGYGESILKGIFFSEVAGAVGRAAAQAMAGN